MSIGRQGKNVFLSFLVSLLLVFSLNIVADAAYSEDYEDQVRWDLAVISEMLEIIYASLESYLPDISDWLETITGIAGQTQVGVDAIKTQLSTISNYLYQLTLDLDTVISKQTTANNYLSWISSDVEDVLEELETVTGALGLIQIASDATNVKLEQTNTYLSQVSTKLDGVGTMVTTLNVLDSSLDDVLEYLDTTTGLIGQTQVHVNALLVGQGTTHDLLAAMSTKLDGVSTMVTKLNVLDSSLDDVLADLDTLIYKVEFSNITRVDILNELRYGNLWASLLDLVYIQEILLYEEIPNLYNEVEFLSSLLESLSNQLAKDGAFTTDISGVLTDLDTMISNQSAVLTLLQQDGAFTTDISGVLTDLDTMISNQSAVLTLLQQDGVFTTDISGVLTNQQQVISQLTDPLTEGTLAYNVERMVELLEGLDNIQISGDLSLGDVAFDTSALEKQLKGVRSDLSIRMQQVANVLQYLSGFAKAFDVYDKGIEGNQQKIIELLEDLELTTNVTIENIENITIDVTNKAYEVFYITDSEGNEQNLADFSGDVLTISGRLLNFFFKVAFDDALDSVDSALNDMTEFYIDDSVLVGGGSLWE